MDKEIQNERRSMKEESCHQKPSNLIVADKMSCTSTEFESLTDGEEKLKNMHEAFLNSSLFDNLDFSLDIEEESSEYLRTSVNRFKEKYKVFMIVYLKWKKARIETIKKLMILQGNIHNDQLKFNKANAVFKNVSVSSRQLKMNYKSTPVSILSSFTTLVTDVVGGFTSFAQALNIDTYIKQFAEIMDKDIEITKHLYNARSIYFEQYKDIEEVLREYHPETFSNTVSNMANVLRTDKLWSEIELKLEKHQIPRILDTVNEFININISNGAVGKAYSTFQDYAKKNPAALDACNSAGKVICDIYDTFDTKSAMLLNYEITQLSELHAVTENGDNSQAALESDILSAIIGLQSEIEEVDNSLKKACMDLI